jgi:predicted nuclease of predicted toxin-antitoxin system
LLKFLIDECLSPDLAQLARDRGFNASSHVTWLGKAGWKDWQLRKLIVDEDWTFVTRNSVDFRGPAGQPGSKGQYADLSIHAGLICINGLGKMTAEIEAKLFSAVLDQIGAAGELVNEVIEVFLDEDEDKFEIARYLLPGLEDV